VPVSATSRAAGSLSNDFLPSPAGSEILKNIAGRGSLVRRPNRPAASIFTTHSLTPREQWALPLVSSGLLNKQIAAALRTTEMTVRVHRGSVIAKDGGGIPRSAGENGRLAGSSHFNGII